jgi:periplasmic protein TonB
MPRVFTIASIVAHVVVAGGVFVAQLLAVGPLPIPHTPITFVGAIPIAIIDPPPPPRAHAATPDTAAAPSANSAPLVAPDGVAPESPRAPVADVPPGVVPGIDGGVPGFGTAVVPPPPPPPPPPAPQPPLRLRTGIEAPRKIVNVNPEYPRVAQLAHVEGVVILEAVIDARGRVESVRVLRSLATLDQAAVDAVKQWVYTPALLNGVAVPVYVTVTVNFKLDAR